MSPTRKAFYALSLAISVASCGKNDDAASERKPTAQTAEPAENSAKSDPSTATTLHAAPARSGVDETLADGDRLLRIHQLDAPLSHSHAKVSVFSTSPATPFAAVLIGRRAMSVAGKVIAKMRCQNRGRPCLQDDVSGAVGNVRIDVLPAELKAIDGKVVLDGVVKAIRRHKGSGVAVIADRRVTIAAIAQVVASIERAGARAILAAVDNQGRVVLTADQGFEAPLSDITRIAEIKGLPERIERVAVNLRDESTVTELHPKPAANEPIRTALHGDRRTALSKWADRISTVYPRLKQVTAGFGSNTPYADVVPVLDLLRDRCAKGSRSTMCNSRRRRFESIRVIELPEIDTPVIEPPPGVDPRRVDSHELMRQLGGTLTDPRASLSPSAPIPHDLLQVPVRPPVMIESMPGSRANAPPHLGGPGLGN